MEESKLYETRFGRFVVLWCYGVLLLFVAGFFFLESSKHLNNFFYIALCLPMVVVAMVFRPRFLKSSMFFRYFVVLAAWLLLTGFLISESPDLAFKELKPILYIFLLAVAVYFVSERHRNLPLMICYVILISATVSGLLLIFDFYAPDWNIGRRLGGSGVLGNSIWVGAAYGLAALISIILFLDQEKGLHQAAALLFGVVPLLVMLASQSRGPAVAFVLAVTYSMIIFRNRRSLFLAVAVFSSALLLLIVYSDHLGQFRLLNPGGSYRLEIWGNAIDAIGNSPFFGHGIAEDSQNSVGERTFDHFHNVYLTLVFHSGIIGLLLFAPLVIQAIIANKCHYHRILKPLLVFGLIYMVFNASRLFTSPKELWLIFWIPLLLLWAGVMQSKQDDQRL